MVLFEVYLVHGGDPDQLMSPEMIEHTGARIMTLAQARKAGFSGMSPIEGRGEVRYVVVDDPGSKRVHSLLDRSDEVVQFNAYEIG